jgi:hypothetical protein
VLEIRNGSMPLLLVRCTLPSLISGMGHSATCAADAPMSEKVSKPDTEPRRAHVTNVPIADLMGPFFPSKQTFSVSGMSLGAKSGPLLRGGIAPKVA